METKQVHVFAPASIANVGAGFDVLGIALEQPGDIVIAERCREPGLHFSVQETSPTLFDSNKNVAAHVAELMMQELKPEFGITMVLHKKMPVGSGLGSSGASCAAAVFAVNQLLVQPLEKMDLMRFAVEGERLASGSAHADNVAPSLLGGACLIRSYHPLDIIQLPVKNSMFWIVAHPDHVIRTEMARGLLPQMISLSSSIEQSGNLGALIAGLITGDNELIGKAIIDKIAEPVRAPLIPAFNEVKQAALAAGALGFSISGSGPSVFAVAASQNVANQIADAIKETFSKVAEIRCDTYVSRINLKGAKMLEHGL